MTKPVSRLAPSPTGALHLGNARTFLVNWALARNAGWQLAMRIEDLDGPRIKPQATEQALSVLSWLGLDWDGETLQQSNDLEPYRAAIRRIASAGRCYSCRLTRKQIEQAATAPHHNEHELHYPPELRPTSADRWRFVREDTNYRLAVQPGKVSIDDQVHGRVQMDPAHETGDFVIWTRRGQPSYQLAVVVDDIRQGVTDVVRGDDLLSSAARQQMIYDLLGQAPPRWWHLPLVLGPDGRRLAKRHGDTRLVTYRDAGVPPERIVGLLARYSGITPDGREEMSAEDFRRRFDLNTLPRQTVTFTAEDEQWLQRKSS